MTFEDFLVCLRMTFEDFSVYLKALDSSESYKDVIATLKPYGRVTIQFEHILGQPGGSFTLYDSESLFLFYQFIYCALTRDAVNIDVLSIETSYEPDLSMDIIISNVGCVTSYEEDVLIITRMDLMALLSHLKDDYNVDLTIDAEQFICDVRITHGKYTPFVNCNVLFERTDE